MILYDKDGHPYTWFSPMDYAKLQGRLDKELKKATDELIMELQGEHNG